MPSGAADGAGAASLRVGMKAGAGGVTTAGWVCRGSGSRSREQAATLHTATRIAAKERERSGTPTD